ncbi:MAG: putative rane protein [Francisellaceae bacterium]|nr:putative rane protein [Francisellaceae bacterium]
MKKIAILQSNYIPWKGYFDIIAFVDEFIFYDDVQYTKRDWRNRNQIKTPTGLQWITVPVKNKHEQSIRETEIDGFKWAEVHWKTLCYNYKKACYFNEISHLLAPLYLDQSYTLLSEFNRNIIKHICAYLNIKTKMSNSWDYTLEGDKNERLINICKQASANLYVSGNSAKNYINEKKFHNNSLDVIWFDYSNYPPYPQLWNGFSHFVSIIDLLFNCGKKSNLYMKYVGKK